MRYRCIKPFNIEKYDEDCMPTGKYNTIAKDSIWEKIEGANYIGGEVHLESEDLSWIEITEDTLEAYFERVD